MREADVVRKIGTELREQLPHVVIFKLQDYMTTGIPDLVINFQKTTTYVEVKLLKERETPSAFRKHFDKLQLATLLLLEEQAQAWYLIAYPIKNRLHAMLISPLRLARLLEDKSVSIENFEGDREGELKSVLDHLAFLARGG